MFWSFYCKLKVIFGSTKAVLLFVSKDDFFSLAVWFEMVLIIFWLFSGGEGFTHSHFVTLRTDSHSKCFVSCQTGEFASWSQEWHRQGQSLFPLYKNQVHVVFKSPTSMSAVPAKRLLQMHFQGMDLFYRVSQQVLNIHSLKITQNVTFEFLILAFSINFCPIKTDLSGNTVWPQASGFQKLAKMDHFWHF